MASKRKRYKTSAVKRLSSQLNYWARKAEDELLKREAYQIAYGGTTVTQRRISAPKLSRAGSVLKKYRKSNLSNRELSNKIRVELRKKIKAFKQILEYTKADQWRKNYLKTARNVLPTGLYRRIRNILNSWSPADIDYLYYSGYLPQMAFLYQDDYDLIVNDVERADTFLKGLTDGDTEKAKEFAEEYVRLERMRRRIKRTSNAKKA